MRRTHNLLARGNGEFNIMGVKNKFKEGDEIHIIQVRDITLRNAKEGEGKDKTIEFKVKRDGEFLKSENGEDIVLRFNGTIFLKNFEHITNLRRITDETKKRVEDLVDA